MDSTVADVEITAPSAYDPGGVIRLDPRPFRPWRDGIVAAVFVVAIVGCATAAAVWGHAAAVLGGVYSSMAFLVWIEAFRSTWAVGPDALAARRWARWRTLRAGDVSAVEIDPGEPGIDLSISGGGLHRVVVPLEDWRGRTGAIHHLGEFLANAQRGGARIDPAVWDAVSRP
jgi:hypothetical protein